MSDPAISIPQHDLLQKYGSSNPPDLSAIPRSQVTQTMTECATACLEDLHSKNSIHGVISVGGSSGTSLTAAAMRRGLPFLIPKLIVSTMASGDTAPFVGESDITLMYSIVDIAGSNSILNGVLDNAAGGIVGMARAYQKRQILPPKSENSTANNPKANQEKKKTKIGITMFGVTTPCCNQIRTHLTSHHPSTEIYIFHATGHGGRAMERLISSADLDAIIDLTTSEITDEIVGGFLSAGPHRLEAGLKAGIPYIISVGACEMANFGPRNTVPQRFEAEGRKIYKHNEAVTLVRADVDESRRIGEFIAGKVRGFCERSEMVNIVLPVGGISPLSVKGGPFEDKEADEALFASIEEGLRGTGVSVLRDERVVNDQGFAVGLAESLMGLVEMRGKEMG